MDLQQCVELILKTQHVLPATSSRHQLQPTTGIHQNGNDQHVLFAMGVGDSSMNWAGAFGGFLLAAQHSTHARQTSSI